MEVEMYGHPQAQPLNIFYYFPLAFVSSVNWSGIVASPNPKQARSVFNGMEMAPILQIMPLFPVICLEWA